ncbi:hypothetical protein PILCRDRAFT_752971 [Piloderma croceum F 1598]|uniref:Uncharacterized protein n=1 Tax=Piloderma croceum (strain F 1598) TaxID=765440 RepID=A0A0C3ACJ6_PILCF|nr:hypothetical protein PILCRDRAFT_752971 [Piloderma croceum F 1598]
MPKYALKTSFSDLSSLLMPSCTPGIALIRSRRSCWPLSVMFTRGWLSLASSSSSSDCSTRDRPCMTFQMAFRSFWSGIHCRWL